MTDSSDSSSSSESSDSSAASGSVSSALSPSVGWPSSASSSSSSSVSSCSSPDDSLSDAFSSSGSSSGSGSLRLRLEQLTSHAWLLLIGLSLELEMLQSSTRLFIRRRARSVRVGLPLRRGSLRRWCLGPWWRVQRSGLGCWLLETRAGAWSGCWHVR